MSRIDYDSLKREIKRNAMLALVERSAVPVVRCGECRWFDRGEPSGTVEPIGYRCKRGCRFVDADDFCKYGERREE